MERHVDIRPNEILFGTSYDDAENERRATRRKVNFFVKHTRVLSRAACELGYFSFTPAIVFFPLHSLVKSPRWMTHLGYDSKIESPADVNDGKRAGKTWTDVRENDEHEPTIEAGC